MTTMPPVHPPTKDQEGTAQPRHRAIGSTIQGTQGDAADFAAGMAGDDRTGFRVR
jgi:hypothetical protein